MSKNKPRLQVEVLVSKDQLTLSQPGVGGGGRLCPPNNTGIIRPSHGGITFSEKGLQEKDFTEKGLKY